MNLEDRIERLEMALQCSRERPVILFLLQETEAGYAAQQADIERMKEDGRSLILLSDDDGAWAFEGTRQVFPAGEPA